MSTRAAAALALLLSLPATVAHAGDDTAPRELPPQARELVEQASKTLTTVQDPDAELSCDKAVENAHYGLDTMLEVGQRNLDAGYMKRADFEATAARFKALREQITLEDCRSASGPQREFYRCMSSDYNHVAACASQLQR